jgi:hypothetical protein
MKKVAVKKTPLMKNKATLNCKGLNKHIRQKKDTLKTQGRPTKVEVYRS